MRRTRLRSAVTREQAAREAARFVRPGRVSPRRAVPAEIAHVEVAAASGAEQRIIGGLAERDAPDVVAVRAGVEGEPARVIGEVGRATGAELVGLTFSPGSCVRRKISDSARPSDK